MTVQTNRQEILIVEDDESIADFQKLYFEKAGYAVTHVTTGGEALARVTGAPPALVVLDLGLPDMNGIEVCKRLRDYSDIPIIIVTASGEDVDRIIGLEIGADDYLAKPFLPRELIARAKAILRRANPERGEKDQQTITHGRLTIDAARRECRIDGDEIQLSPKEFDLLWELLCQRGRVLKRDQLLTRVWGYQNPVETRTVDVHVRQLRQKISDEVCPIVTVWGVGYKITPEEQPVA